MSEARLRGLHRIAAAAALVAFALLPRGHLRGHEELAAAGAAGTVAEVFAASPGHGHGGAPAPCRLCLSLGKLRSSLARPAVLSAPVPPTRAPYLRPPPSAPPEAVHLAGAPPRAPPAA